MSNDTTPTVPPATPNAPTAARVRRSDAAHWYRLDGSPCHEVPKADGRGMRKSTLADARKLNLLPSVTTILKLLHKEGLVRWMIEQACLAVLTAPRQKDEAVDAFVLRVLQVEEQQNEEVVAARETGNEIHDALNCFFEGVVYPEEMKPYVVPVTEQILAYGQRASSEVVLTGDDYAGTTDLIQDCEDYWGIIDFKSAKKLPDPKKGAWDEHRLQLAAYAKAFQNRLIRGGAKLKPIICRNVYVSSVNPGEFVVCEHEGWEQTYEMGFAPLVKHWQWSTGYRPENPNRMGDAPAQVVADDPEAGLLRQRVAELETQLTTQALNGAESIDEYAEKLTADLQEARAQATRLNALLAQARAIAPHPTAPPPTPPPAPRPTPAPTPMAPASMGVTTPVRQPAQPSNLPTTDKEGRKIQWSVGTQTK